MPVGGRVAGKVGIYSSHYNGNGVDIKALGKGYSGINEEIIWISIGMGIAIAVLITIALCYIAREKCRKRHEGYYSS
ncbi:uncharacterized protein LOC122525613 isoform X1 [Polistes fuscatus]|nr:PREDICTED: uncharacterized protein LOC106790483 isoform X1 [Polistes canadensis]XP_015174428.1 PREDICTED: uncharacterized protein LOC107065341 isoform X3 [Polistes dominula]XP_043504472.1 uncharacterized protein LOC122525613 isoform X1 [Polistes fuscatus]XP_043504473.1 uncharacterized protein LOC122525613 isoform X1 [Polistes fuscatus]